MLMVCKNGLGLGVSSCCQLERTSSRKTGTRGRALCRTRPSNERRGSACACTACDRRGIHESSEIERNCRRLSAGLRSFDGDSPAKNPVIRVVRGTLLNWLQMTHCGSTSENSALPWNGYLEQWIPQNKLASIFSFRDADFVFQWIYWMGWNRRWEKTEEGMVPKSANLKSERCMAQRKGSVSKLTPKARIHW